MVDFEKKTKVIQNYYINLLTLVSIFTSLLKCYFLSLFAVQDFLSPSLQFFLSDFVQDFLSPPLFAQHSFFVLLSFGVVSCANRLADENKAKATIEENIILFMLVLFLIVINFM